MSRTTYPHPTASAPRSARPVAAPRPLGARDMLGLSAWCGLAAGLVEVGTKVLWRSISPKHTLYQTTRHFVWLAPLTYFLLFLAIGLFLAAVTWLAPRRGGWLSRRLIVAGALMPGLMVAGPRIYLEAWLVLAFGAATRLVPPLERHAIAARRWLRRSFPCLVGVVLIMAVSLVAADSIKQRSEARRPLPPADAPNVLLIVMDTVRADHLSLYGYGRTTTPRLQQLATQGILFQNVRATAPWTLPSHASLFTGRWPHELGVEWLTPLRGTSPTLAEYLGSHGYATAGFAANTLFCSYDTGLDRGFAHYEDYELGPIAAVRTALVVDLAFKAAGKLALDLDPHFNAGPFRSLTDVLRGWVLARDRISAQAINLNFADWLTRRREPRRPFFAFLNYYDAHAPYIPPTIARHQFGLPPRTLDEAKVLERWIDLNKLELPRHFQTLARDAYDNCLAYLDEQLGVLFDELQRRGELDRTWVIVTSDHGEGLGEHDLFDHGESLYRTEINVPLMIVPPAPVRTRRVVKELVSLRNLPATIVEVVGLGADSPFLGPALASLWRSSSESVPEGASSGGRGSVRAAGEGSDGAAPSHFRNRLSEDPGRTVVADVISELTGPNPSHPNEDRSPARRGPLVSLADGDYVYIRNEGDGVEELFNVRDDPGELHNQARNEALRPVLERFRERVKPLRARP
jgi:arylsulfatase A-like enzyme